MSGGRHPVHDGGGHALPPWARPLPGGRPNAPSTSTLTPYIHFRGEKNQREGFIAFYNTDPPPSPKLSQGADLESVWGSGEGNPSPSSSSTLLHDQFHDAHRRA